MSSLNSPPYLLDVMTFLIGDIQVIFLHLFLGFTCHHLKRFAVDLNILPEQPNTPMELKPFLWAKQPL